MKPKVKIGIIGAGQIAKSHAKAYLDMEDVEIIGVADVNLNKAEQFINELNIKTASAFQKYEDMLLLDINAVSVCTPNFAHFQTSVDALKAKKHVIVEKPLAVTLNQGIEMVKVAKANDKILSVGYQPRYDPNMKRISEIINSGKLGDIYYVEIGGGRRRGMPGGSFINKSSAGVGALGDIGTYSIDLALNALGNPRPLTVSAYTTNHFGTNPKYHPESNNFEVEDFGVAMVRLERDITMYIKISWAMHMDTLGPGIFLGKNAGLKITPAGAGPWSGVWDGGIGTMSLFYDKSTNEHVEEKLPIVEHSLDIFSEKIKDFVNAVKNNKPAPIPGEDIILNQAIIDAIIRSSESGKEIEIELPEF